MEIRIFHPRLKIAIWAKNPSSTKPIECTKPKLFFFNYYTLLNSDFLVSETEIALLSKGIRYRKKLPREGNLPEDFDSIGAG